MNSYSERNEGLRMLEEFVCEAIPDPSVLADPTALRRTEDIDRSTGMVRLVYFLNEYARTNSNGRSQPPAEFGDLSWREVYEQFFTHLGDGREFETFRNSAEGLRKGNIREHKESGLPFLPKYEPMLQTWVQLSREQQWAHLQQYRVVR